MPALVLYQPEIPQNTGNIARLAAAAQVPLHLIQPLGFSLRDKYLKRAGLDYWSAVDLTVWPTWSGFLGQFADRRLVFTSARRGCPLQQFPFDAEDMLVFGPETQGIPAGILDLHPDRVVRIPMRGPVRSLNLATSAGIVLFEALRRSGCLDAWGVDGHTA